MAIQRRTLILSAFILLAMAPPLFGQADSWQGKWFWGAQPGVFYYSSPLTGDRHLAITAGGNWLITGKRSALYIGFDHVIFRDSAQSAISDPTAANGIRFVDFSRGRRIQATVFAIPMDKQIQVMLGGGFAIQQLTDAAAQGPFTTLQQAINANNSVAELDTKAFLVMAAGVQYRIGRLAVFANYNYMPSSRDWLITSDQHALMAGVRYLLTNAHEDVSTNR
jgi:hypothetical protein